MRLPLVAPALSCGIVVGGDGTAHTIRKIEIQE